MSPGEIELLKKYLPFGGKVLEFGSGNSSSFFFANNTGSLVSVESDRQFLESLGTNEVLVRYYLGKKWTPIHANIGATEEWGAPKDKYPRWDWLNYHEQVWELMPHTDFDLILIDGRFRVACLCQSLLRCENREVVFLVHDFWDRPQYHDILKLCALVDRADTLAVFKRKRSTDWKRVCLVLQKHQFCTD